MLRRVVWGNYTAIIIRAYDGRSRTLCNVSTLVPDNTVFLKGPVMILKGPVMILRKRNFIEVAYTYYD
jgi:hypothetical protein